MWSGRKLVDRGVVVVRGECKNSGKDGSGLESGKFECKCGQGNVYLVVLSRKGG